MRPQLDPIGSEERKTLERLNRQARRESRRRSGDTQTERSPRVRTPRPRVRRLTLRLCIAMTVVLVLLIVFPPFLIPVDGTVTSRFFLRTEPESLFLFDAEHHRGIDIGAALGTPVRAARSGRVVAVSEDPTYGLVIDVRHPLGLTTRYAHLSATNVREGQWVWRRKRLGSVGMTGRATGPHLHFEIRAGDRSLPPGLFLVFSIFRRSIVGSR